MAGQSRNLIASLNIDETADTTTLPTALVIELCKALEGVQPR